MTAAGPGQHHLPLQTLVDRHGVDKTALQLIIDEVVSAGIEEVCVVICPGDAAAYARAAGEHAGRIHFVEQGEPRGYGDALWRARHFIEDQPFLHLVSDHLYLSEGDATCARQLVDVAAKESCSVSAVQATRENKLPYFGTVAARRLGHRHDLYEVTKVVEKPTPTQAEQELVVAGLRAGSYLCLFGMHVLSPVIMDILEGMLKSPDAKRPASLSDALSVLANRERVLALQLKGVRHNIGMKYGLLMAQLALALSGADRDEILTELLELLAIRRDPA